MKKEFFTIVLVVITTIACAQESHDALIYSQNIYQGSAKSQAMGGAMGSVGGDMGATCINPAGQGFYRSSELATTLSLQQAIIGSKYYGNQNTDFGSRITIPHFSYVIANERNNKKRVRYTQFGIGLTRTNDFNYYSHANGLNPNSSLIDQYLQQIDGMSPDEVKDKLPLTAFPAWDTYLIDTMINDQGQGIYVSPVPQGNLHQDVKTHSRGRSEEWTFAYSANFSDRFFLGASIGLTRTKHIRDRKHYEETPSNYDENNFKSWSYEENIQTRGTGVNLKVGAIYYPANWVRFGLALHTPTRFSFDENISTATTAFFTDKTFFSQPATSYYNYALNTPAKAVGSLAFLFQQRGMISTDLEVLDYGSAYFISLDGYDYAPTNKVIADTYSTTLNLRVGTEWIIGSMFLRGGIAYYGSPYGLDKTVEGITRIGLGLGFPISDVTTFDLACNLSNKKAEYYPYMYYNTDGSLAIKPIQQSIYVTNVAASIKFRF